MTFFNNQKLQRQHSNTQNLPVYFPYLSGLLYFLLLYSVLRTLLFLSYFQMYECIYLFALLSQAYIYFYTYCNLFRVFFHLFLSLLGIYIVFGSYKMNLKFLCQPQTWFNLAHVLVRVICGWLLLPWFPRD